MELQPNEGKILSLLYNFHFFYFEKIIQICEFLGVRMKPSQSLSEENSHILKAVMLALAVSQSIKYLNRYFVT